MARVSRIGRARDEVFPLYEEMAADLNPTVIHSDLSKSERSTALDSVKSGQSRIIVCVDMLGEGFDLPTLKIAALHDPHRSLGVSLQFIGRISRGKSDLGPATAVVPKPSPGFDPRLHALYAEDRDWNEILHVLTTDAVEEVEAADEFDSGFSSENETISRHSLRPKMSAAIYRAPKSGWNPERISEVFAPDSIVSPPSINHDQRVVWLVVESTTSVRWADVKSIENTEFHLHLVHHDAENGLLYINTTELESLQAEIAEAVCGEEAEIVSDEPMFRALSGIVRAIPTTIGLVDFRNRARRFSMFVGADVYEGFPTAEQQSKSHTNLSAVGYENGEWVAIGVAKKGRVWTHQSANSIHEWVDWCRHIGPKLSNENADLDSIFRNFVRPQPLEERPPLRPLAIDWPWIAFSEHSEAVQLRAEGVDHVLVDAEFRLTSHETTGPFEFDVCLNEQRLPYKAQVKDGALVVEAKGNEVEVIRPRSEPEALSTYLNREGVMIWFEEESLIDGSTFFSLERDPVAIDLDKLIEVDWSGVNIQRESQGQGRQADTVQYRAAERLQTVTDWDVVVDDDVTGEVADLVAMKVVDDRLVIHLVHCKFSSRDNPGARVKDLYEVCGQTHRSAHYRQDPAAMVDNLVRREKDRQADGKNGMIVGLADDLLDFQDHVRTKRPEFHITIAQPGLSKEKAAENQLNLLGATDLYVSDIAVARFEVWCSA